MIDVEVLLAEAKESPPCGPNLEHDLAFFELEELARGKPEQRIGEAVKPAEDPSWAKVADQAQGLLLRTKDLRLALHLTRALTRTEGIPGLAAGLALVHGLVERYWDAVHPRLDPDDDNDPTERLNTLAPLSDPETVIKDVRDTYLVDSRELGQLQAREVEIALGRLAPSGNASATRPLSQIHAQLAKAFGRENAVPVALRDARDRVVAIQTLVSDRAGERGSLDLKPLVQCIDHLLEACDVALGGSASGRLEAADAAASPLAGAGQRGGGTPLSPGELRTRDDAVRALDLVCQYLERHEPTNPAPLFIRRAQRLMTKNFIEIVKDLLPDSLSTLERLAGEPEPK